ncbi:alpha-tocopherol transfer protein-like [Daktulosphaira vitifoliae]|uniref:alpha-tocopherol transfer protein-like n=1 Tax=Daktulosphaira vitifoliae TaxID=58002 RepID=UPI0021AA210C|nr:alpha-tocopherol transfer protein-like [Daktulosphaira vitifoliae]XP_050546548.1 alpha-tocopherol transfer protein-like [Daktulosphaira vitifoliae]XP_050546556.1 alpha-tocopherol transfer protein-like [Daktulosphaira vitifoliae]XP_050546564.1 alpha-tocopherol transfer protein-like [Daktulosphaira vitifoliae]XP_050546574.1 alpha-tocopherol transfer protein-like [Daktulosphaira vitifoliae]XP_050546577.1 alpha-tocopherol transfer protein-like [Daktulosphaira vitifoliae]
MLEHSYKRPEGPLSEEMLTVRRLLGMTEESIKRDVKELMEWLKEQPDLPDRLEGVDTAWWLENYLIMNKNCKARVKENLPYYFRLKELAPDLTTDDRDPFTSKEMCQTHESTTLAILPNIMESGDRVVLFKHNAGAQPCDYSPLGLAMIFTSIGDLWLAMGHNNTRIIGIVDLSTVRLGYLARYPLGLMRRFFLYAWKAYPERIAKVHIINPPSILNIILSFFKPFLKAKMRKRIVVHRNLESLIETIPLKYLPKDYGGEYPSTQELHEHTWQKIKEHQAYLRTRVTTHNSLNTSK